MKKFWYLFFFLLLFAIFIETGWYLVITRKKTTSSPTPFIQAVPSSVPTKEVFGLKKSLLQSGLVDVVQGKGVFEAWEEIPDSNDFYAILANPENQEKYKVRILVAKSFLSSAVGSNDLDGGNRTRLEKEGEKYYLYNLDPQEREKLIIKGSLVAFYTIPHTPEEAQKTGSGIRRDEENIPAVMSMIVD